MTYEEFYGSAYKTMKKTEEKLSELIILYSNTKREKEGVKPVVYFCSRIKTPESMMRKLARRGYDVTVHAALNQVFDAIGIRVVCAFAEDVYRLVRWLKEQTMFHIIEEKDYYEYPKPNGYRSYHILIRMKDKEGMLAEIQVRTIANDFWATLEHQLKYKKDLEHEELIRKELKRCADEIASVDLSMQTIRDIIRNGRLTEFD